MPYRSNATLRADLVKEIHMKVMPQIKRNMQRYRDDLTTRSMSGTFLLHTLIPFINAHLANLNLALVRADINDEAHIQFGDNTYDWAADLQAISDQLLVIRNLIVTRIPQTNGWINILSLNPDGTFNERLFNTTQTAPLVAEMNVLLQMFD